LTSFPLILLADVFSSSFLIMSDFIFFPIVTIYIQAGKQNSTSVFLSSLIIVANNKVDKRSQNSETIKISKKKKKKTKGKFIENIV
jgi:hypothetical protein